MVRTVDDIGTIEKAGLWLWAGIIGYQAVALCLAIGKIADPSSKLGLSVGHFFQHLIDSALVFGAVVLFLFGLLIATHVLLLYVLPAVIPIYAEIRVRLPE